MHFRLSALFLCAAAGLAAAPLDVAIALFRQKRFPEARALLEQLVAAKPDDAEACHYLGLTLSRRDTPGALDEALPWLEKAVALRADDADILGDYGGVCLLLAGRHRSLSYAHKGRVALEQCLALAPGDLEAREGLMRYYQEAPWPLGSRAKARHQAEEINRRDSSRGLAAFAYLARADDDYAGVFALCEQALRQNPDDYVALYEFGRAAAQSGEHLDRGLTALTRCLALSPPPDYPGHAGVRFRLGRLHEKRGDRVAARAAYEAALALDDANPQIREALARLQ